VVETAVGPGAVVLDIGADTGAAVVIGPAPLAGKEIEIRPEGGRWDGHHVAFHRRPAAGPDMSAAVFPQLASGRWEVRLREGSDGVACFEVTGGRVTTLDCP
jgi:hypothetical protein